MSDDSTAAGGLVAIVPSSFVAWYEQRKAESNETWPNYVAPAHRNRTWRGRLKNFFVWDKGWGFPLRGGMLPRVRDLMPTFRAERGGIQFHVPPGDPDA